MRALSDIEKGEEISISYTSLYQSTRNRQLELMETYHFECVCVRCKPVNKKDVAKVRYFDKSIDEVPNSPLVSNLHFFDPTIWTLTLHPSPYCYELSNIRHCLL